MSNEIHVGYVREASEGWEALVFRDAEGRSLEIQRGLAAAAEDFTHCVVLDGGPVAEDGIEAWRFAAPVLSLRLSEDAQQQLGLDEVLAFTCTAGGCQLVEARLGSILGFDES